MADAEEHSNAQAMQNNGRKDFMLGNPDYAELADELIRCGNSITSLYATNRGLIIQGRTGKKL